MAREHALQVLVVAPDPLARAGLAALLAVEPGVEIVGQLGPAEGAGSRSPAGAVVWDLGPPGGEGFLPEGAFTAPTLALAPHARAAVLALAAGARGVLARDATASRIVAALAGVADDLVVIDRDWAPAMLGSPSPARVADPESEHFPADLTPREAEVLQLLARGLANKEISAALSISEHTTKFHVNAILAKLGAQSRTEAVVRAARAGLVVL